MAAVIMLTEKLNEPLFGDVLSVQQSDERAILPDGGFLIHHNQEHKALLALFSCKQAGGVEYEENNWCFCYASVVSALGHI